VVAVVVVKSDRKGVILMDREMVKLAVELDEVDLLRKLVSGELDRRCQAVDDIIVRVYDVVPARHEAKATDEIKSAVLELVRSNLADLERKLACVEVKPEPEPEPEPEVKPEPEPEVKPEPVPEPAKSKG